MAACRRRHTSHTITSYFLVIILTGIDCPSLPCHVTTSWAHWLKIQKITLVRFSSQIEIKICIQKRLCSITTLFSVWKLLKRRCWLKLKIQSTAKLFPLESFEKKLLKGSWWLDVFITLLLNISILKNICKIVLHFS